MSNDTFRRMMERMEDTFRDLESTFRDFEHDFDKQFGDQFEQIKGRIGSFPVDVQETDSNVVVKADLPGIEKDQIDVNVTEYSINIQAQDEREVKEEGKNYVRQERRAQNYQRSIRLPVEVDPGSAEANYTNGVLTVTLAKTDTGKGSNIEIT